MSYSSASDVNKATPPSSSSTPQPHPSLPARPPPSVAGPFKPAFASASTTGAPGTTSYPQPRPSTQSNSAFTAFKPRAVPTSNQEWRPHPQPAATGPAPQPNFSASSNTAYQPPGYQQSQYSAQAPQPQQYYSNYASQPAAPNILNPFPLPNQQSSQSAYGYGARGRQGTRTYDSEMEDQIAQWQSTYMSKDETAATTKNRAVGPESAGGANAVALGSRTLPAGSSSNQEAASATKPELAAGSAGPNPDGKQMTVVRSGGGQSWQDPTLLEWDPTHFRLFVGNLAGEVTDDSLLKAFSKYESVQKARVIRDKRTTKSKGFAFVSFRDSDDYFRAAKEMQGKYIGSHPVLLRRSTTEIRPTTQADKHKKNKNHNNQGTHTSNKHASNTGSGVSKKQAKTKGGLKILG